jgi:hypothetical protein
LELFGSIEGLTINLYFKNVYTASEAFESFSAMVINDMHGVHAKVVVERSLR